jgi:hypothetical protein
MQLQSVLDLVDREMLRIGDEKLTKRIRQLLVTPYPVVREWDYNPPDSRFTCWTVLEHTPSNTAVAYCAEGFGPSCPWGVVAFSGPVMNIGMDDHWFTTLEAAVRVSVARDLPSPAGYELD